MSYPDIIVSGAGTSAANGTYAYLDINNGKPRYKNASTNWMIRDLNDYNRWAIYYMSKNYYVTTENVATPDLVTMWTAYQGSTPVPTVTAAAAAGNPHYYYAQL